MEQILLTSHSHMKKLIRQIGFRHLYATDRLCWKYVLVAPSINMRCIVHNDLCNIRPVSYLCFIVRILKKLVICHVSELLILSFNGFHLIWLIVHTTSLYLIIALILLLYTQVFLRVQFLALFFSPCILSLCLPLLTHTLSYIIHLLAITDLQLQMPAPPDRISELLHSIQSCISDIKSWATVINSDKQACGQSALLLDMYSTNKDIIYI